jgi:hypothetical protein
MMTRTPGVLRIDTQMIERVQAHGAVPTPRRAAAPANALGMVRHHLAGRSG